MKIGFSLALITLFLTTNIFSQQDADAKRVIGEVAKKYPKDAAISFTFKMETEIPDEEDKFVTKGKVLVKNSNFKLFIDNNILISDSETLWYYNSEMNEVQINSAKDIEESNEIINPQHILDILHNPNISYLMTESYLDKNEKINIIECIAPKNDAGIFKYKLHINSNYQILKIKSFSNDGYRTTLSIEEEKISERFPQGTFIFNTSDYPEVHVEDLRID